MPRLLCSHMIAGGIGVVLRRIQGMGPVYLVREQKSPWDEQQANSGVFYGRRSRQYMISAQRGLRFRHEEKRERGGN